MLSRINRPKRLIFYGLIGVLIILVIAVLVIPYPYSDLIGIKDKVTPMTTSAEIRYMSEITGINTPEDMQRQYDSHPVDYKFTIDDDLAVMFAYPSQNVRWTGMVFIHQFPSVSEIILDYDGNVIYEQITSPEVQARIDGLLNDNAFVERLQNQMDVIWELDDPGVDVLDLVNSLEISGIQAEFLGGRPQTLFDASMFLVRISSQDIRVYEFADEGSRRNVSENISPDGYEFTQQQGEITKIIHIEYLDQPNFWAKGRLLVQYLGIDPVILELLSAELGDPLTPHSNVKEISSPPASNWQTYSNPYFKVSLDYPGDWQHLDGEAHYGEKFGGEDGYFTITAMGDVGLTLDQAVQAEVQHKLQPYGPDPLVEVFQVQGQEARLILPSESQVDNLRWQAALLVLYPQPISLTTGDMEHKYPIFALYADPAHIRGIAESLQFDKALYDVPTPFSAVCTPPACAPDEMYHCPGDCPGGCGTTCATATPGVSHGNGQVWGDICGPGETIPEMVIYFQDIHTQQIQKIFVEENQGSYQLTIPAGVYVAFAWLPDNEVGGGFTQFVRCNQQLSACEDHSLIPFLVQENHVTVGVDICDWGGDTTLFPILPE
jgi:hypothetical protein